MLWKWCVGCQIYCSLHELLKTQWVFFVKMPIWWCETKCRWWLAPSRVLASVAWGLWSQSLLDFWNHRATSRVPLTFKLPISIKKKNHLSSPCNSSLTWCADWSTQLQPKATLKKHNSPHQRERLKMWSCAFYLI